MQVDAGITQRFWQVKASKLEQVGRATPFIRLPESFRETHIFLSLVFILVVN